jgi:Tol biopolymer transport system component
MSRQRPASGPTLLVIAAIAVAASLVGATQVLGGSAPASTAFSPTSVAAARAPHAIPTPATSIAVVRREAGHDALWSVASADGTATKLVDLPFRPMRVEASPDGTKLALLRSAGGPRVAVYDITAGTLKSLSLAPRGVKQVDAFTWLSNSRLLVSGSRTAAGPYALNDRLYSVNVANGTSSWFRNLRGTEPSVAAGGSKLVYVRLSDGGRGPVAGAPRLVIERLLSIKLGSAGTPHVIAGAHYSSGFDIRAFRDPRVSPNGSSVISSTTRSDVGVTYAVRAVATGKRLFSRNTQLSGRDATAWDAQGARVAFWGMPSLASSPVTRIYVFDLAANKLTGVGRYSDRIATGLSWAADGSRLAYTLSAFGNGVDQGRLWIADPATPAGAQVLGAGGLPSWLP